MGVQDELQSIREEYAHLYQIHGNDPRSTAYLTTGSFVNEGKMIRAALGDVAHKRILDVGCGPGILTQEIAQRNTVIGVDIVSEVLEEARGRSIRPARASASRLPFEDGTFDLAIVSGIVPCMKELGPYVRDACRVVKRGGHIYMSNLNTRSLIRKFFWLFYTEKNTVMLHDRAEIAERLTAHGIEDIEICYNFYPLPFVWKLKQSILWEITATGYALVGRAA